MNHTMRRSWGLGLFVIGAALLAQYAAGDSRLADIAVGTVVILTGQLLPLPPRFEAWIMALPLLVRLLVAVVGVLILALPLLALIAWIDPLSLPLAFLIGGAALLIGSTRQTV